MTNQPETGVIPVWTLGDRLRKARQVTGMTTREFAAHIGVSQATVTNAENDNNKVRVITLRAWALATGVPVAWLETGNAPRPDDGPGGVSEGLLPHLDSNQEPSDIQLSALVGACAA